MMRSIGRLEATRGLKFGIEGFKARKTAAIDSILVISFTFYIYF